MSTNVRPLMPPHNYFWGSNPALPATPPDEVIDPKACCFNAASVDTRPISPEDGIKITIIGVGYVGLHLVESFAPRYSVTAFDTSAARLESLHATFLQYPNVTSTTDARQLKDTTHFLIAVPTTLRQDRSIDISYLEEAIKTVTENARPGATVVIESSVGVGMTRELLGPLMRLKGIKGGMSPERVDPGRSEPPAALIPKVISGLDDITPGSLASICEIYSTAFHHIVPVSKPEVAEMMKLYENCQRMICIAYANEMADACLARDIDPYEVCSAAATKPFGYLPFTPGLGVGGPCIPCNPYYLLANNNLPLLQTATEKMWQRPQAIARRIMSSFKPGLACPRILIIGVGFKKGQSLTTHSSGAWLADHLQQLGGEITFADPLVSQEVLPHARKLDEKTEWTKDYLEAHFDRIVVAVKQDGLDYSLLEAVAVPVEFYTY